MMRGLSVMEITEGCVKWSEGALGGSREISGGLPLAPTLRKPRRVGHPAEAVMNQKISRSQTLAQGMRKVNECNRPGFNN